MLFKGSIMQNIWTSQRKASQTGIGMHVGHLRGWEKKFHLNKIQEKETYINFQSNKQQQL